MADEGTVIGREHAEIGEALERLAARSDGVGVAAKALASVLQPHLEKEEELVVPVLEVLGDMALGGGVASAESAAAVSGRLSAEYHELFREHAEILERLEALRREAEGLGAKEALELCDHLKTHIALEEEVLYPAALIASKYAEKMVGGEIESYKRLEVAGAESFKPKER